MNQITRFFFLIFAASTLLFFFGADVHAEKLMVEGGFCTTTANTIFRACKNNVQDDYWIATAYCINISNDGERDQCQTDAVEERDEENELCSEQLQGRLDVCQSIGENRYDPNLDPDLFESDTTHLSNPNPYFPLTAGNVWEYSAGTEGNVVKVLNRTKLIEGITVVIVRDTVKNEGHLHEDTDDWYVQAKDGNVWYFGEEVKNYETFEGDRPQIAELVSNDGSFKSGVERAKPGIIFLASPAKGNIYIEEFSLGNAEDVTRILSANYSYGSDSKLDKGVPKQLAQLFCSAGDCVVTKNFSLLEPGVSARKYYARGIGVFLEVESTGEVSQLVNCNFDARCSQIPTP